MRRILSGFLALAMVLGAQPLLLAAVSAQQNLGEIAGTAVVEGKPLNNITVRLRNVDSEIPNVKIKVQSEEAAAQEALEPEASTA